MESASIKVQHICKKFASKNKEVLALDDISLEVKKGELYGLIGPDGSGKTTLFRILTTVMLADQGEAFVEGFDVVKDYKEIRRIVGYMPGRFSLYQDLSVEENLTFFATLFNSNIQENYHLIRDIYVQLEPFKNRKAAALSGGMKQKLALCCALIHKPEVLFLDEPTTGVDPVSRKEFWDMLNRLKQAGITIMASTPYMDEAKLCDNICLIQQGKIIGKDNPENIRQTFQWQLLAVRASNMFRLLQDLRNYPFCYHCFSFGEYHHLSLTKPVDSRDLNAYLLGLGHQNIEIKDLEPNIEDCFMHLNERMD